MTAGALPITCVYLDDHDLLSTRKRGSRIFAFISTDAGENAWSRKLVAHQRCGSELLGWPWYEATDGLLQKYQKSPWTTSPGTLQAVNSIALSDGEMEEYLRCIRDRTQCIQTQSYEYPFQSHPLALQSPPVNHNPMSHRNDRWESNTPKSSRSQRPHKRAIESRLKCENGAHQSETWELSFKSIFDRAAP